MVCTHTDQLPESFFGVNQALLGSGSDHVRSEFFQFWVVVRFFILISTVLTEPSVFESRAEPDYCTESAVA